MTKLRSAYRKHEHTSFYKYVTAGTAKVILRNGTLRWSSPLIFPDRFDVPRRFEPRFTERELNEIVVHKLADLVERGEFSAVAPNAKIQKILRFPGLESNREQRKGCADELRAAHASGQMPFNATFDDLRRMWDAYLRIARILCLTMKRDNGPMWQHYAAGNTGALIELECSDSRESPWLLAREVTYHDDVAFLSAEQWAHNMVYHDDGAAVAKALLDMQYYKKTDWAYEREWRLASSTLTYDDQLFSDFEFNKRDIASVTLGALCSGKDRADLMALLMGELAHVKAYQAIFDSGRNEYGFRPV